MHQNQQDIILKAWPVFWLLPATVDSSHSHAVICCDCVTFKGDFATLAQQIGAGLFLSDSELDSERGLPGLFFAVCCCTGIRPDPRKQRKVAWRVLLHPILSRSLRWAMTLDCRPPFSGMFVLKCLQCYLVPVAAGRAAQKSAGQHGNIR